MQCNFINLWQKFIVLIIYLTVSAKASLERKSDMPVKFGQHTNVVNNQNSVTMYNHATRDMRDVCYGDKRIVFRDTQPEEDAYSQAMKESSLELPLKNDTQKKVQDSRSRIALTKQNVEKEFKDTIAFLNSLPKQKSKPIVSIDLFLFCRSCLGRFFFKGSSGLLL